MLGRTGHVVDHHSHRGVSDVAGYEAAEALLACCIPADSVSGQQLKICELTYHRAGSS